MDEGAYGQALAACATRVVNGELTEPFDLEDGMPQGSILSPFHFVMFAESLGVMLHGAVKGVCTPSVGERISTTRYADDLNLVLAPAPGARACACAGPRPSPATALG